MNAILVAFIVQLCALPAHFTWVKEMENNGAFQGDMILDPDELEIGWNGSSRGYASIKGGRWPGAVVPYVIGNSISSRGIRAIHKAIAEYHKHTCIRWKPRTNEGTFASFYKGRGCSSRVGYRAGRINYISLAPGCWYKGVTMHEMGHTLGFYHEQSRVDRDKYVRILWGNIKSGKGYNFNKLNSQTIDSLGTPYDFRSMMHYGSTAFGKQRGTVTIQAIDPANQRFFANNNYIKGFSSIDIKQLNLMYKCRKTLPTTEAPTTAPTTTAAPTTAAPTTTPKCVDKDSRCPNWARIGFCRKNPSWASVGCKKSCNFC